MRSAMVVTRVEWPGASVPWKKISPGKLYLNPCGIASSQEPASPPALYATVHNIPCQKTWSEQRDSYLPAMKSRGRRGAGIRFKLVDRRHHHCSSSSAIIFSISTITVLWCPLPETPCVMCLFKIILRFTLFTCFSLHPIKTCKRTFTHTHCPVCGSDAI